MKKESGQQLAAKSNGREQSRDTKDLLLSFFCKLISHPLKKGVVFDDYGGQKPDYGASERQVGECFIFTFF